MRWKRWKIAALRLGLHTRYTWAPNILSFSIFPKQIRHHLMPLDYFFSNWHGLPLSHTQENPSFLSKPDFKASQWDRSQATLLLPLKSSCYSVLYLKTAVHPSASHSKLVLTKIYQCLIYFLRWIGEFISNLVFCFQFPLPTQYQSYGYFSITNCSGEH